MIGNLLKKKDPKFSISINQLLPELYMDNEGQGTPPFFSVFACFYFLPSLLFNEKRKQFFYLIRSCLSVVTYCALTPCFIILGLCLIYAILY